MKKSIIYILAAAVALASCQTLDLSSSYQVASSNVWGKATLARQAVAGIYNEFYVRSSTTVNEDSWNVMYEAYSSVMDTDKNWYENQKVCYGDGTPANGTFSEMFKYYYTFVFRANDVISHIDQVPDMDGAEKAKLKAEAKFLRAYGYMNLNVLYRGVPLYMEYIENASDANRPRSSENEVWEAIIQDLSDCVGEENLPDRYKAGSEDYGHVSKAVALAYRGQAYQWMAARSGDDPEQYIRLALEDFKALENYGFALYKGAGAESFKMLLKPANEQCDEMIFAIRCTQKSGMGNPRAVLFGNRDTGVTSGAWNNYIPNPAYVESFENSDGSKFDWEQYCPGWHDMTPAQRSVFFLRNEMTDTEIGQMTSYGSDMSKYEKYTNESRIKAAYDKRDPRLKMAVITPYSTYYGGISGNAYTFTLRWPYRADTKEPRDIRTDTNSMFYYLWRKYVPEGLENTIRWVYEQDNILCRYAEILLRRAECENELGNTEEAVRLVNLVRERAGHILLNTNGLMQMWGTKTYTWYSLGDYVEAWPIPAKEREMNPNLTQNPGWND